MPDADLPRDLHYVDDTQPGIRRKTLRGKFQYFDAKGERIQDPDEGQLKVYELLLEDGDIYLKGASL